MSNDELLIAITDMFDKKVEEVKLHAGVLVEELHKDVKAIAEGHSILDNKIDNLQKEMTETKKDLKTELNGLQKDISVVKDYIIGVDTKLNEHEVILKRVK